jgi:hypothetical protein
MLRGPFWSRILLCRNSKIRNTQPQNSNLLPISTGARPKNSTDRTTVRTRPTDPRRPFDPTTPLACARPTTPNGRRDHSSSSTRPTAPYEPIGHACRPAKPPKRPKRTPNGTSAPAARKDRTDQTSASRATGRPLSLSDRTRTQICSRSRMNVLCCKSNQVAQVLADST